MAEQFVRPTQRHRRRACIPDGPSADGGGDHAFADPDLAGQMGHVTTAANHPTCGHEVFSKASRVQETGGQLGCGAP